MKLLDRQTFLAMPPGTLYAKIAAPPYLFVVGDLCRKGDTVGNDWWYTQIVDIETPEDDRTEGLIAADAAMREGLSFPMAASESRDGLFDDAEGFIVFEMDDLHRLRSIIDEAVAAYG